MTYQRPRGSIFSIPTGVTTPSESTAPSTLPIPPTSPSQGARRPSELPRPRPKAGTSATAAANPFGRDLTKKGKVKPKDQWNAGTDVDRGPDLSLGEGEAKRQDVGGLLDQLHSSVMGNMRAPQRPQTQQKSKVTVRRVGRARQGSTGPDDQPSSEASSPNSLKTSKSSASERDTGSIGRRAEVDRYAKAHAERLEKERIAAEALRLLHQRLFATHFEAQQKRRTKIEAAETEAFADLVAKFQEQWEEAKRKEALNAVRRQLVAIKDAILAEEGPARRVVRDEERAARVELEAALKQGMRELQKMGKEHAQQAAEREKMEVAETTGRQRVMDELRDAFTALQGVFKKSKAKAKELETQRKEGEATARQAEAARAQEEQEQQCADLAMDESSARETIHHDEEEAWREMMTAAASAVESLLQAETLQAHCTQLEEEERTARDAVAAEAQAQLDFITSEMKASHDSAAKAFHERCAREADDRGRMEADEQRDRDAAAEAEETAWNAILDMASAATAAIANASERHVQAAKDALRSVEREEDVSRGPLRAEEKKAWESLLEAASAALRIIAGHLGDREALDAAEAAARLSLTNECDSARAALAELYAAAAAVLKERMMARFEVEDDEEGARAGVLAEEEAAFSQLCSAESAGRTAARDLCTKRLREEQAQSDKESTLAQQLEAASNIELQREMLNNRRQERTEKLIQSREARADGAADTVPTSPLEDLIAQWVPQLIDQYLLIHGKVGRGEAVDEETGQYNSLKLQFAMQLSLFKRANPPKRGVQNIVAQQRALLGMSVGNGSLRLNGSVDPVALRQMERATATMRPFIELLVRDKDTNRTNITLMNALLTDELPIDFVSIVKDDGLVGDAAVDGSVSYFDAFLGLSGLDLHPTKAAELMTIALNNPIKRIQFAECIMRREHALSTMAVKEDMRPIWQRFFFAVATRTGLAPDAAGQDQRGYVVQTMVTKPHSVLISLSAIMDAKVSEALDTVVTRLCVLGDIDMLVMLMKCWGPLDFGDALVMPRESDEATPLICAVEGNHREVVQLLLQFPHVRETISHRSSRGSADAIVDTKLDTDDEIAEMIINCAGGGEAPDLSMTATAGAQLSIIRERFKDISFSASPESTFRMGQTKHRDDQSDVHFSPGATTHHLDDSLSFGSPEALSLGGPAHHKAPMADLEEANAASPGAETLSWGDEDMDLEL